MSHFSVSHFSVSHLRARGQGSAHLPLRGVGGRRKSSKERATVRKMSRDVQAAGIACKENVRGRFASSRRKGVMYGKQLPTTKMGCLEAPQKRPSRTRKEKRLAAVVAQLPTAKMGCLEAPQKRPLLMRKEKGSVGPAVWLAGGATPNENGVSRGTPKTAVACA